MVAAPSIDMLNSALAPVEVLRGEQTQLETSLRESFAELESLHDELADWQRELTRQQADLDQRAAAVADAEAHPAFDPGELADMQQQLLLSQEYSRQLEEENAEQLQTVENLERQLVAAQTELRTVRKRAEELSDALETERERALDEHRLWSGELRDMRRLLEHQGAVLESLGADPAADDKASDETSDGQQSHDQHKRGDEQAADGNAALGAADWRRRANHRRARRRTN